jgi:hypothetical protein
MLATIKEPSFSFVSYDGPKLSRNPGVRKLIRQRAMRDVAAARKQSGSYGKHNLRQYPVFETGQESPEHSSSPASEQEVTERLHSVVNRPGDRFISPNKQHGRSPTKTTYHSQLYGVPMPTPAGGLSSDFALLLNVMPLTGIRLGVASGTELSFEPLWTDVSASAGQLEKNKLLSFIPSRYGRATALTHATDCVVAKLRLMMLPVEYVSAASEATVLMHYSKALSALQASLNDEAQRMTPETLCATELLGIYEVKTMTIAFPRSLVDLIADFPACFSSY